MASSTQGQEKISISGSTTLNNGLELPGIGRTKQGQA